MKMGQYFADVHASAASQLGNDPCDLADSPEVAALRSTQSYEELLQLGKALCYQLRYHDAIEVYSRAIAMEPDNILAVRQRAARYITTLQPGKAVEDFLRCRKLGGDEMDISYRLGICYYLAENYSAAMAELTHCFPLCDDEMGIAVIFWHTLCAWRSGKIPSLLYGSYREGMKVGHHTAYAFAMKLAAERISHVQALEALEKQTDDLEYSIMTYGVAEFLDRNGMDSSALRETLIERDSFWISYCYIAAWKDAHRKRD
jgi:tetratricopeptide (TPR) repeat protein